MTAYWLVKSEPDAFCWDQQVANGVEPWTGVRNHTAKNHLKAMRKGDRAFFYHSNVGKEIVGVVEVVREAYPDPTAKEGDWVCVDMKAVGPMPKPVDARRDQGRPGFRRDGSGAPIAAFGHAGLEGALGPHLPDGRVEECLIPADARLCARSGTSRRVAAKGFPPLRARSPGCSPCVGARTSASMSMPAPISACRWTGCRTAFSRPMADRIVCSTHGAEFRIEDGLCIGGPCRGDRLESVPAHIERGVIMVPENAGL